MTSAGRRTGPLVSVASACIVATVGLSGQQRPARDLTAGPTIGTASIMGTVVSAGESPTPLRRVTLKLTQAGGLDARVTATDDSGRYLFDRLPAGTYLLTASKGAYVPASYGTRVVGVPPSPIPLAEGQRFAAEPMRLIRGAVVTGRLATLTGIPIAGARVLVSMVQTVDGKLRARSGPNFSSTATTDLGGEYRVYGLAPGPYVVSAMPPTFGRWESREASPQELAWARQQVSNVPGAPFVRPPSGMPTAVSQPPEASRPVVVVPTFYPGTPDQAGGTVLDLAAGAERSGVDFPLLHVPGARVSGTITGLDDQSAALVIVGLRPDTGSALRSMSLGVPAVSGPAGMGRPFIFSGVPPGEYSVIARTRAVSGRGGVPAEAPMWGMAKVFVTGVDIENVTVYMQPAVSIAGRVSFTGDALPGMTKPVSLTLLPVEQEGLPPMERISTTTGEDGTFRIAGVVPGTYRVEATLRQVAGRADEWLIRSAVADGIDVLDAPLEIRTGANIQSLALELSNQHASLSGRLLDATGGPGSQFFVLAYPVDRTRWTPSSRWIRHSRTGVDGSYRITGLPAGEYYVCALTELDTGQLFDPDYLDLFVPFSIVRRLAEGEALSQDMKVGGR